MKASEKNEADKYNYPKKAENRQKRIGKYHSAAAPPYAKMVWIRRTVITVTPREYRKAIGVERNERI
jgi:hypothetical protein